MTRGIIRLFGFVLLMAIPLLVQIAAGTAEPRATRILLAFLFGLPIYAVVGFMMVPVYTVDIRRIDGSDNVEIEIAGRPALRALASSLRAVEVRARHVDGVIVRSSTAELWILTDDASVCLISNLPLLEAKRCADKIRAATGCSDRSVPPASGLLAR
jgi:hypothetical protein